MTTFLLLRHGLTNSVGVSLTGRARGVSLNDEGERQAQKLAQRLAGTRVDAIHSSPLERTLETAERVARPHGLEVIRNESFLELDFGEWTERSLESLGSDERWRWYNEFRSGHAPPNGESMLAAQLRAVQELRRLQQAAPASTIAVVSHGDVLRAILLFFLGMPLDLFERIEIAPASISRLQLERWGARVLGLNELPY